MSQLKDVIDTASDRGIEQIEETALGGTPTPSWEPVFQAAVGANMGYSYAVAQVGQSGQTGYWGYSRFINDQPATDFAVDTRINLASVSKSVTAVAVLKLLAAQGISVDAPFYQYLQSQFPSVAPGVDAVTIGNLLTMKSGLVPDGTLYFDSLEDFLSSYLQRGMVGTPGQTYAYSNTNFTILQCLVHTLAGQDYAGYVTDEVLTPMGIDATIFNTRPGPRSSATLEYSNDSDSRAGAYFRPIPAVAAGGWVANAPELLKFLTGVRAHTVLSAAATRAMFRQELGWYSYQGSYGTYYHHNGGLSNGLTPKQGLSTGIVHFTQGYDAVLLTNSPHPGIIRLMIDAFQAGATASTQATEAPVDVVTSPSD